MNTGFVSVLDNVIKGLKWKSRCSTRVVYSFPGGNFALMLVCAQLSYEANTQWDNKKYMNVKHLESSIKDTYIAS